MKRIDLSVKKREKTGKGAARSSRRAGLVPAVVYGGEKDPQAVAVDLTVMEKALQSGGQSENILVNLLIEGESDATLSLVRATQHDPLKGTLEHVDFYRVSTDKPITTTVPIHTTGTPAGVRAGGVFEQSLREVEIACLPLNIPSSIEVDVSYLELNQTLHVSDLPQDANYTILTASERSIATVAAPQVGIPGAAGEAAAAPAAAQE